MRELLQTLDCMDCDEHIRVEIDSYDNLGTLVEEMSIEDGRAMDAFITKHYGHTIEDTKRDRN